jgi:IS6 family transposase
MSDLSIFKWHHFQADIILCAVRWYLRYALSYRDVEELLLERGVRVDHTTVFRWVQRYAPELDKRCRPSLRATNDSYRVDETYSKIKKQWYYLYRAVDSPGATLDFMLSATRDAGAAEGAGRGSYDAPRVITVDKHGAYPLAFDAPQHDGTLPESCQLRQCKYLNNVVEIVLTQLTKTYHLAARMGGDSITNFHVTIGHENPINQELHQDPFLCECSLGYASPHPLTEGSDGVYHPSQLPVLIQLRLSWLLLRRQGLVLLFEFLASPLVFDERDHALQVRLRQALKLMGHTQLALPERFFAGLEFLGEPVAPMGTFQGIGDPLRVGEEITQVMPDEAIVKLLTLLPAL